MRHLTRHPERHDPPSLDTPQRKLEFIRKLLQRRTNILLGRPATEQARILSHIISDLRKNAASHLGHEVTTLGIASAVGTSLIVDELNDALVYLGLTKINAFEQSNDNELNAAYAATGHGLCGSFTDPYTCEEEEEREFGDGDLVLHLDYTDKALAANVQWITSAHEEAAKSVLVDWELGHGALAEYDEDNQYWERVLLCIRGAAMKGPYSKKTYDQLLLTGEHGTDAKFLQTVKDALRSVEGNKSFRTMEDITGTEKGLDTVFAVAKGEAEMQRRRQKGWLKCVQPKHCSEAASGIFTAMKSNPFQIRLGYF